jgi:hypothetical protein
MRAMGPVARQGRRRRPRTTDGRHDLPVAPNLLDRNFAAGRAARHGLARRRLVPSDRRGLAVLGGGRGWTAARSRATRESVGWSMPALTPSRPTACATAAGACRGCSSGSGSRGRRPGRDTRRAARPSGPRSKKGPGPKLAAIAAAHPNQRLQLWCEDG